MGIDARDPVRANEGRHSNAKLVVCQALCFIPLSFMYHLYKEGMSKILKEVALMTKRAVKHRQ